MNEFDFFFTLFGLLLGLIIAEVATKFADAIASRHRIKMGLLTPMLALFMLLDVASFWLWAWSARALIHMQWPTVYGGLLTALAYFLAAFTVFPRRKDEWASLDDYFWGHKRLVLGGVMVANLAPLGLQLSHRLPALDDYWFFIWQGAYWLPLAGLWLVRSRRFAIIFLSLMIGQYLVNASNVLPGSQWGDAVGLNGDERMAASVRTHPPAPSR